MNKLLIPKERLKPGWKNIHADQVELGNLINPDVILIGASIINNFLKHYPKIWEYYFKNLKVVNFGIGGDRVQHVLWRVKYGLLPISAHIVIIHVGTNNISKENDNPADIAEALVFLAESIKQRLPNAVVFLTGIFPRGETELLPKIHNVNNILEKLTSTAQFVYYDKPDFDWLHPSGTLITKYYFRDKLHLSEEGYKKFSRYIKRFLELFYASKEESVAGPSLTLPVSTATVSHTTVTSNPLTSASVLCPASVSSINLATIHSSFLPFSVSCPLSSNSQCRQRIRKYTKTSSSPKSSSRNCPQLKFTDMRIFDNL